MKIQHISGVAVILALICTLSCGPRAHQKSNDGRTNAEAQNLMALRKMHTEQLRLQIGKVRKALEPVDAVLTDVVNTLSQDAKEKVGEDPSQAVQKIEKVQNIFEYLQRLLREASKGMVDIGEDGSWSLTRVFELPLERAEPACKKTRLDIEGQRKDTTEQLKILIQDCAFHQQKVEVAEIRITGDDFSARFEPEVLKRLMGQLAEPELAKGNCRLKLYPNGLGSDLVCDPMQFKVDHFKVLVDPMEVKERESGIKARVQIDVLDAAKEADDLIVRVQTKDSLSKVCRKRDLSKCNVDLSADE